MSQAGQFFINSGGIPIETITGNSGGPISPTILNNINVIGAGDVLVTGNLATHTLTITSAGGTATEYDADSGTASPVLNILNIVGGVGIQTSGAGNTITVESSGVSNLSYTSVVFADSPYVVLATDNYISANVTAGAITIKLPNAATVGKAYVIKDRLGLSAINNITITTVGGIVTIDGATSFIMNATYEAINIIGNGTSYEIY